MTETITLTSDLADCPGCGAPLVRITGQQRQCNSCGLIAWYVSAEDALDAEQMKKLPAQERGKQQQLGRLQSRW